MKKHTRGLKTIFHGNYFSKTFLSEQFLKKYFEYVQHLKNIYECLFRQKTIIIIRSNIKSLLFCQWASLQNLIFFILIKLLI
jgi:hypothetical protein